MNTIAQIEIREVYGNKTVYPINDTAKYLAQLAGTKTLTTGTINTAKNMGFTFEVITPTLSNMGNLINEDQENHYNQILVKVNATKGSL